MTHKAATKSFAFMALLYISLPQNALGAEVEVSPEDDIVTLMSSLGAGDQFIFNDGVYVLESGISWTGIGTASEPIILRAKEGASPIIQTSGGSQVARIYDSEYIQISGLNFSGDELWADGEAGYRGLRIDNSHELTISNIEIQNTAYQSILIGGDCSNISITRSHLHDTLNGDGIYIGCGNGTCATSGATLINNWIHDIGGSSSNGIELAPSSNAIEVVDNVIYQTEGGGIQSSSTNFGEPNLIERNAIWSIVGSGLSINGGALVRNNIVFNIQGNGIYSRPSEDESTGSVVFSHNTVTDTTSSAAYLGLWSGHEDFVFANNALTNVTGIALETDTDGSSFLAGNIITGYVSGATEGFTGGAGLDDYTNAENWNFWPTQDSHLVDSGDGSAASYVPTDDFNGLARSGTAPDSGALERTDASNPGWQIREGFKEEPGEGVDPTTEDVSGGCGCSQPEGEDAAAALLLLPLVVFARRRL